MAKKKSSTKGSKASKAAKKPAKAKKPTKTKKDQAAKKPAKDKKAAAAQGNRAAAAVEAAQAEPNEMEEGSELTTEEQEQQAADGKSAAAATTDRTKRELGSVAVSFEDAKPSAQVMATTSEEFRESLQTLQGSLELMLSGKVPDARKTQNFLGIAYREAQYLNNRANDLQVASLIETGRLRLKLTALDLAEMLNEIVQRLAPGAAEAGVTVELHELQELPALRGDEALMHMLLNNLVERCVRATPAKGTVEIEVELFENRLVVGVIGRGKQAPEYESVSLNDSKERGLSLYIADRVAYAHEGELELLGEGKEVRAARLTLPLEVVGRGRGKILVVDDNPQAATLLEYALEGEGYEPLKAMNGIEGLKLARTERVDLVILDILLPGIDGFEVCHQLRSDPKTASIPVIMVSAKAREEDRATALRTGADAYFGKPLSMAELMTAVENLLEQNQPENWSPA